MINQISRNLLILETPTSCWVFILTISKIDQQDPKFLLLWHFPQPVLRGPKETAVMRSWLVRQQNTGVALRNKPRAS
jgi:hypothetical protein